MIFIGVDPGSNGAVAIIHNNSLSTFPIKEEDEQCSHITVVLKNFVGKSVAAIEDLHPIFMANARSTFALGWACGFWHGVLDTLHIPITLVEPKVWQAEITKPVVKPYLSKNLPKKDRTKANVAHKLAVKAESIRTANKLFPGYDITHDGIADAVCIAAWMRKTYQATL